MQCLIDILLFYNISTELIYHNILPYVPHIQLTKSLLELQRNKLRLYASIRKELLLEDDTVLLDIVKNYQGESNYYYEDKNMFLFLKINTSHYKINHFVLMLS